MQNDTIEIEIIEADGSLKVTTDKISQANHLNADALLREMGRVMGGETIRTHRKDSYGHVHEHVHEHEHEHNHA
jgi:hypothetical protein